MDNVKMDNLLKIAKTYTFTSETRFIELADKENGWSDGYIADFIGKETAKAKATLKGIKTAGVKPEINKIIPDGKDVVVDIEYSLDRGLAVLKGKKVSCFVNPTFLKYFYTAHKYCTYKFVLTSENKAIKVVTGGGLVGLIMPIL